MMSFKRKIWFWFYSKPKGIRNLDRSVRQLKIQQFILIILAFLSIIVIPLEHDRTNKDFFNGFNYYHILGAGTIIRSLQVFLFTISSHGANLIIQIVQGLFIESSVAFFLINTRWRPINGGHRGRWPVYACTTSADFFMFIIVKGFSFSRHIYAGNKNPSLAIDQSKNSTSENFHKCGQCPQPDNPRPYKAEERKSLVRIGCTGGQPNGSMLVCATLGGFIRDEGAVFNEEQMTNWLYTKAPEWIWKLYLWIYCFPFCYSWCRNNNTNSIINFAKIGVV